MLEELLDCNREIYVSVTACLISLFRLVFPGLTIWFVLPQFWKKKKILYSGSSFFMTASEFFGMDAVFHQQQAFSWMRVWCRICIYWQFMEIFYLWVLKEMLIMHSILLSFYRLHDSIRPEEDAMCHYFAVDQSQEVFPLQIRLSFSPETNSLLVKISLKVISLLHSFILCISISFGGFVT